MQLRTSHAGSQYGCGWVGRGIQPPSTPQPIPNIKIYTKSNILLKHLFFNLTIPDGLTNGPTNQQTYRQWTDRRKQGWKEERITLFSKATSTSKTFIVPTKITF